MYIEKFREYLKLFRVSHWIKNLLIFLPLFFSGHFFQIDPLLSTTTGFFSFCMVSSAVYILNDLLDVEKDKRHPLKKKRPIAAGRISKNEAQTTFVILLLVAFVPLILTNIKAFASVFFYLLINIAYSAGCKHIPILDVVLLSAGYIIRIFFGGYLSDTPVSPWLFLTVLSFSYYLGFGKRVGELMLYANEATPDISLTRPVLKGYPVTFLKSFMYLFCGLGVVFYSLWAIEKSDMFSYSVPLVLLICQVYNLSLERGDDGDPVTVVLSNKTLLCMIVIYIIMLMIFLYSIL